ncbi:hypothetical protein DSM104299_00927 [Baekduia alba]|uniref:DUF4214 domain-containing protein n=1 Tax=Baekduia alba TaxID=2997333 RepID=UPI002341B6EF|nr:DUF4214 domain-containing protein [Baekduia alba]WCB92237.1 hypothetical protein DSM104299_00927 [Baekduia alba]
MFDPEQWPDRLNLGCGWDHREGYLNVDLNDFHKPDLVADVTDLPMLPSGRYREIIAQDLLEHLPRTKTPAVLAEWNRLLAVGGTVSIRVPSLVDVVKLFSKPENQGSARQELLVQCVFGTQAYNGDFHYASFTEPLLTHYLEQEGFEVASLAIKDEWLFDVDAVKVRDSDYVEHWAPYEELLASKDTLDFLTRAYHQLLGRDPDAEGITHFAAELESGRMGFREVIDALRGSPEATGAAPSTSS